MGGRLIGMTDARRRLTCLASRQSRRRGGVQNDGALVLSTALTSHPDSATCLARIPVGGQGTDGNAAVPLGPAWWARPTNTNLHALDGCPPRSAGTGARFSAQEIASTLTG